MFNGNPSIHPLVTPAYPLEGPVGDDQLALGSLSLSRPLRSSDQLLLTMHVPSQNPGLA